MGIEVKDEHIEATERELGAAFPSAYREAMKAGGGEIETDDDHWGLHPIERTDSRKAVTRTANHVLRETTVRREWPGFPDNAVEIGDNEDGDSIVFVIEDGVCGPGVHVWDHETRTLRLLASDFSQLDVV